MTLDHLVPESSAGTTAPTSRLVITPLQGIGEVRSGDDLADLIGRACGKYLRSGDILAVTSKVVSKAEGRTMPASARDAAVEQETVRVVASREHPGGRRQTDSP